MRDFGATCATGTSLLPRDGAFLVPSRSRTMTPLTEDADYLLDEQVGFILRKAYQRHMTIFSEHIVGGLTSMQFSTLYRLATEPGPVSQNALGRMVAMDAATTKGVISRLLARGLIHSAPDQVDRRRYMLSTTEAGRALLAEALPQVKKITEETLAPLSADERNTLIGLLQKLC
jgi:MarR family transcriptional regulator, lower aerobic nicotinate degradation pathway regulator